MKRKEYVAIFMLAGLAAAGCAKTPEKAVVREKSEHGIEGYQEDSAAAGEAADGQAAGADGKKDSAKDNAKDSEKDGAKDSGKDSTKDGADTETQGKNTLAQKLQAPETYEASFVSDDGVFQLECGADVFVPDVAKVPIYQVTQKEFTQEFIDRATKAFFGDAPVYDAEYIYGRTKADIEEKLNELKGYLAEGNLDPYGYIADAREAGAENADEYYDLQAVIDAWEEQYAEAPETKEKVQVQPGLKEPDKTGGSAFSGYVETKDGNFLYSLDQWSSLPMDIRIERLDKEKGDPRSGRLEYFQVMDLYEEEKADASLTEEEQRARLEEQTGITKEEAVSMADAYLERLGLLDEFSAKTVLLSRGTWEEDLQADIPEIHIGGYGWQVDYTRDIDGFPVTDEMDVGGGFESMESTIEPWCYETVQFTVSKDGLLKARISNLYEVGERRMENVQMLPFSEISDIFEQMLRIQSADMRYTNKYKISISHVSLGYMRIYDPALDSRTGTMVPVWDFFGSDERTDTYEGETYYMSNNYVNRSYLTVNAADGTVIDRNLGY